MKRIILIGGYFNEKVAEISDSIYYSNLCCFVHTTLTHKFITEEESDISEPPYTKYWYRKLQIPAGLDLPPFEFWVWDNISYPNTYTLIFQLIRKMYENYINEHSKVAFKEN